MHLFAKMSEASCCEFGARSRGRRPSRQMPPAPTVQGFGHTGAEIVGRRERGADRPAAEPGFEIPQPGHVALHRAQQFRRRRALPDRGQDGLPFTLVVQSRLAFVDQKRQHLAALGDRPFALQPRDALVFVPRPIGRGVLGQ